jgi:hypothetical protein
VFQLVALYFSEIPCQGIFNEIRYNDKGGIILIRD